MLRTRTTGGGGWKRLLSVRRVLARRKSASRYMAMMISGMRIHNIVLLVILIQGCSTNGCSTTDLLNKLDQDGLSEFVFGPTDANRWKSEARDLLCQEQSDCTIDNSSFLESIGFPSATSSFWKPESARIQAFHDALVQQILAADKLNENAYTLNLADFDIQFIGLVIDEKAVIYAQGINCSAAPFCEELSTKWFQVLDGGDSIFRAAFDPQSGAILFFGFNGVA